MSALSKRERQAYTLHTTAIRDAVGAFEHSAKPHVIAIYKDKLYREHGSFEQFLDDLGIARNTAYYWLQQEKVSSALGAPVSGRVAAELAKLPEGEQAAALAAAGGAEATSPAVRQVRELLAGMSAPEKAAAIAADETEGRRLAKRVGARDRVQQIERLAGRCKKLHAGLVDVADAADEALDAYLVIVRGSAEAA